MLQPAGPLLAAGLTHTPASVGPLLTTCPPMPLTSLLLGLPRHLPNRFHFWALGATPGSRHRLQEYLHPDPPPQSVSGWGRNVTREQGTLPLTTGVEPGVSQLVSCLGSCSHSWSWLLFTCAPVLGPACAWVTRMLLLPSAWPSPGCSGHVGSEPAEKYF